MRNLQIQERLILLLVATSLCFMWFFNFRVVEYYSSKNFLDGNQIKTVQHRVQAKYSVKRSTIKQTSTYNNPVLIPSKNKRYHLKHLLEEDLKSEVVIHSNETYQINGDVSSYLSFALIGFSKTGTTSLLKLLSNSSETMMLPKERCDLVSGDIPFLLNSLHRLQHHGELQRGLKCPQDIWSSSTSIQEGYKKYFHKTKLIIGLRHPVLWFESMYNFNVRNLNKMPQTHNLKKCVRGSHGVCASRMNLADFMSWLNKTPLGPDEKQFMTSDKDINAKRIGRVGQVFLYEVNQLESDEKGIAEAFRRDLAQFLDIQRKLPKLPHISTAGSLDFIPGVSKYSKQFTIDICDEVHSMIRSELMEKARMSSTWITRYFLKSKEVHVSSKEYFVKQLKRWNEDPCIERREKKPTVTDVRI